MNAIKPWHPWLLALGLLFSWPLMASTTPLDLPDYLSKRTEYTLFEVGQVRPLAMSKDGAFLYATNTPDDHLEVFKITDNGIKSYRSIAVGIRPVAVAEAPDGRVWVVNHLSDSISIVNIESGLVEQTLWVGDEPRDIVFAGTDNTRAFITTAHRGQNSPIAPQLTTPGIGRADVWVFDADVISQTSNPQPLTIVTLFSDTPRALTKSPDGSKVYAAAFHSGNQTTALNEFTMGPNSELNTHGEDQPVKGVIAKYIDGAWTDTLGNDVTAQINFNLPDHDVFTIDANATIPTEITGPFGTFDHVGTTLFNMAVNPRSGALYVANTEANNFTRFEGPGLDPVVNTTVRGNIVQSRITVIKDGDVQPVHINKHIDYSRCCETPGNEEARKSLAFPRQMVVSGDGKTLYVAAFGSAKIGVFDTEELESNSFQPSESAHIKLSGGGPAGLVLDEVRNRLYVLTRFNNAIDVVNLNDTKDITNIAMHNPEPESITKGRPFLYDAFLSSSHGDSACASCHIDGDTDHLAWDLGDPTLQRKRMPGSLLARSGAAIVDFFTDSVNINIPYKGTNSYSLALPDCRIGKLLLDPLRDAGVPIPCSDERVFHFSSNKGPMVTQTLAGLDNHGPMHWRGDRTGGSYQFAGTQPNSGMFNERTAFKKFNVAFPGLLGRDAELTDEQMNLFTDFMLQNTLPPNPIRNLDNSLTVEQAKGKEIFLGGPSGTREIDFIRTCNQCHTLDVTANQQYGVKKPGFFGTDGRYAFVFISEILKIPHMRNLYQKVGMFAIHSPKDTLMGPKNARLIPGIPFVIPEPMGDQIRGFGYTHDGSLGTMSLFYQIAAFVNLGPTASEVTSRFISGLDPNNLGTIADILIPSNDGGFLPYVEPGTWPSDAAELPAEFKYLAKTNDPFFSQINPETGQPIGMEELAAIEAFSFAFPTNMAPIIGQQVTVNNANQSNAIARVSLMEQQAVKTLLTDRCDLVAKAKPSALGRGFMFDPQTLLYLTDNNTSVTLNELIQTAAPVTFTCAPPGDGVRLSLDRDGDQFSDTVEIDTGFDPADKENHPTEESNGSTSLLCRWFPYLCRG